jgi:two-component system LytT family response regulator
MPDLRILIADDEAPARTRMRRLLGGAGPLSIVGEAADGDEAVRLIRALSLDLVLLDIQMPGRDGFGVIDAVGPEAMPHVVFVTAYDEHALRAFEVRALDYLLKPVALDRLCEALDRVRERMEQPADERRGAQLHDLVETVAPRPLLQRILVHVDERALLVPVERIDWIEADRNYVWLHVAGKALPLRQPISSIEDRLDPQHFLRVNRSVIVRIDAIGELQPWSHGDYRVVLTDGTTTMWSRRYRAKNGAMFGG